MKTPTVDVRPDYGRLFVAYDLMEDEEFIIEYSMDAPSSSDCRFSPLVLDGKDILLTESSPTWIATIPGYYRVIPASEVEIASVSVSDPFQVKMTREV